MSEKGVLRVRMLGGFDVEFGGKPVHFDAGGGRKVMQLFQMLLLAEGGAEKGLSKNSLADNLYGQDEVENRNRSLNSLIFRLRRLTERAGIGEGSRVVRVADGICRWDTSEVPIDVDVLRFKELVRLFREEQDETLRWEHCMEACRLYRGEFLPMCLEEWAIYRGCDCKRLYTDALAELSGHLIEQKEYAVLLPLAERAAAIYPFDEWQGIRIRCLTELGRHQEALKVYEETAQQYYEELGMKPTARMEGWLQDLDTQVRSDRREISEIQKDLEERWQGGGYYCSYLSFIDSFYIILRLMERLGKVSYLIVCKLVDGSGVPMKKGKRLDELSGLLKEAIGSSLRTSDLFTRNGQECFLILANGTNREDCGSIIRRIRAKAVQLGMSSEKYIDCRVCSCEDLHAS